MKKHSVIIKKPKAKNISFFVVSLLLFLGFNAGGIYKYLIFPIWTSLVIVLFGRGVLHSESNKSLICLPAVVYVLIGTVFALINGYSYNSFKDSGFTLLAPFCVFLVSCVLTREQIKQLIMITYLLCCVIMSRLAIIGSAETQYAFIMSLFAIYYLGQKKYLFVMLSIALCYLGDKRIAFMGLALSIVFYLLFRKKIEISDYKKCKRLLIFIGSITLILMVFYVWSCKSGYIAYVFDRLGINTMGRLSTWSYFYSDFKFSVLDVGHGIGYITDRLYFIGNRYFTRLHNDVLRFYIELGFIGFCLYFLSYFYILSVYAKKNKLGSNTISSVLSLIIFTMVCFMTDNISIYTNYLFVFYLLIISCLESNYGKSICGKRQNRQYCLQRTQRSLVN